MGALFRQRQIEVAPQVAPGLEVDLRDDRAAGLVDDRRLVLPGVQDVTVRVERGRVVGILGPNGSGKTTLLRLLAGMLRPESGAVTLDGRVETVAQDGDNDGSAGQLDGPSEAVARGQELIVANFDRVFPGCVNTQPDKPYTLAVIRKPR